MKQFRKVMSLVLVVLLILPVGIVSAEQPDTSNEKIVDESTYEIINALMDEYTHVSCTEPVDTVRLALLQAQLEALGVEFLDEETVAEQYPDAYEAVEELQAEANANSPSPRFNPPTSDIHTWTSTRVTVDYSDGQTYNVQHVTCSPKNANSPLYSHGSVSKAYTNTTWAGNTTILKVGEVGSSYNYYTKTPYSLYSSRVTGMTSSSEVKPTRVAYQWENRAYICFSYVRLDTESDTEQNLGLVSSRCSVEVDTTFDGTIEISGGTTTSWNSLLKTSVFGVSADYYQNSNYAIAGYKAISGYRAMIYTLRIYGAANVTLTDINPPQPYFPGILED